MSTSTMPVRPIAITGCGVLSAPGNGLESLADAMTGGPDFADSESPESEEQSPGSEELPPRPVRAIRHFSVTDFVARRGTKHLDRTTRLGLAACSMAIDQNDPDPDRAFTGVVVGTSTGSIRSSSEFARDTLVHEYPYLVEPAAFPNTVMNCCAGQIAIWNSLRGVNATVAAGSVSSLSAMRYARNALVLGYAPRLVVGGVEELCPQSAWAWHRSGSLTENAAIGESAALFVTEPETEDTTPMATVLACEIGFCPPDARGRPNRTRGLATVVERALRRSGVSGDEVGVVALGATGQVGLEEIEQHAVDRVLGGAGARRLTVKDVVGECYSANGALQLAAILGHWSRGGTGEIGLVTSIGNEGNVGAMVVRRGSAWDERPRRESGDIS